MWAIFGGFVPALVWLWFWLKEDESPEPRVLLLLAFLGGMLAIPLAFVLEKISITQIIYLAGNAPDKTTAALWGLASIGIAAFIEEFVKYISVLVLVFWRADYDEPADAMIYLITAALGFAALENTLYLQDSFSSTLLRGFAISNLRFIGATLLHALSSATLGYFIAGSFWRGKVRKEIGIFLGLLFATLLHALFNLSILLSGREEIINIEPALIVLVSTGIVILFSFERIKHKIKKYYA
jgi:RsiW-degrading membrane proteinase PrsW (M82 family)